MTYQLRVGQHFGGQQPHVESHAPLSNLRHIFAQERARVPQLILLHALHKQLCSAHSLCVNDMSYKQALMQFDLYE